MLDQVLVSLQKGSLHNRQQRCASKPKIPSARARQNDSFVIRFGKIHPSKLYNFTTTEDLAGTIPIG
jgi:hypothetical protein